MDETRLIGAYFGCIYSGRRRSSYSNSELIARTKSLAQTRQFSSLNYNCIDFIDELLYDKAPGRAKYKIAAVLIGAIAIITLLFKALF